MGRVAARDDRGGSGGVADPHSGCRSALSEGGLEIIPSPEWYLKDGKFDAQRVIQSWQDKLEDALARGYAGMRINGNEDWFGRDEIDRIAAGVIKATHPDFAISRSPRPRR